MAEDNDAAAAVGDDIALFLGELLDGVVAPFDIDIGAGEGEEPGGAEIIEDADGVHRLQGGEHEGAVGLRVHGASGAFELADGGVGVDADEEDVGLRPRGGEVVHMAEVQDVEAAVGGGEFFPLRPEPLAPRGESFKRKDFGMEIHPRDDAAGRSAAQRPIRCGCAGACIGRGEALGLLCEMKKEVVPVQIRGILPANSGAAIFLGNDEKVFVIQVEATMASVIGMFLRDAPKERPLTHDLINSVFKGLGVKVERIIITELKNSTYFARLILHQENELGRKIVEVDARPSDCLALASAHKAPIYVSAALFAQVEDMSEYLDRINEEGAAGAEESET